MKKIVDTTIQSIDDAVTVVQEVLQQHPERDIYSARQAALNGENRDFPVMGINHLGDPEDTFVPQDEPELPEVDIADEREREFAQQLINTLEPLKMLNPINPGFGVGGGTGTLVTCFGVPLDPECNNAPAYSISIDEVLSKPMPDPKTTGLMPEIHDKIKAIKDCTPDSIRINLPDTQGPFNIAHTLTGSDALMGAYLEPDKFREFMDRMTTFWIESVTTLREWIGEERLNEKVVRIAECAVNLVSREMYEEFILPCDLRINEALGPVGIHTCSGQHVFYGTLENIPNMVYTEAGYISMTAAGYTPVEMGIKEVTGTPIMLNIGQELHDEDHFETIRKDLDYYEQHNRLVFFYTGMKLRKKDRPYIRDLHQRLDEYWQEKYWPEKQAATA